MKIKMKYSRNTNFHLVVSYSDFGSAAATTIAFGIRMVASIRKKQLYTLDRGEAATLGVCVCVCWQLLSNRQLALFERYIVYVNWQSRTIEFVICVNLIFSNLFVESNNLIKNVQ